jgi:hypothetical protein
LGRLSFNMDCLSGRDTFSYGYFKKLGITDANGAGGHRETDACQHLQAPRDFLIESICAQLRMTPSFIARCVVVQPGSRRNGVALGCDAALNFASLLCYSLVDASGDRATSKHAL